ncbi:GyrI-like domain-containing protein [Bacillus sp. JJ664]
MTITEKILIKNEPMFFIGNFVTTSNQTEMSEEALISKHWEKFYSNQLANQIPSKKNPTILALYTNYESDENGSYSFAIGAEVSNVDKIPDGMDSYSIKPSEYIVFTTRKGPVQEVVVEAWQHIWEWSKTNKRAFTTDFELYDERSIDPNNSQVDIYISIK